jgi:hypothetical protein
MTSLRYRSAAFTVTCLAAVLLQPMVAPAAAQPATGAQEASAAGRLDLGPADLVETRTVERLQPGVTLTVIRRGAPDPALSWTLEVRIPATAGAPDPAAPPRVLSDLVSAEAEAVRLRAAGLMPRVEAVAVPRAADVAPGVLGFRVRVGAFASRLEADAALSGLVAAGSTGSAVYTGWDGDRAARGPWTVRVLTLDPARFRGALVGSYGPDLERRETPTQLAAASGATAAVNGGYFVLDPASGAPGDPAGVGCTQAGCCLSPWTRARRWSCARTVELRWGASAGQGRSAAAGCRRLGRAAGRPQPGPRPDPQLRR